MNSYKNLLLFLGSKSVHGRTAGVVMEHRLLRPGRTAPPWPDRGEGWPRRQPPGMAAQEQPGQSWKNFYFHPSAAWVGR